jgi:hypothetical protein
MEEDDAAADRPRTWVIRTLGVMHVLAIPMTVIIGMTFVGYIRLMLEQPLSEALRQGGLYAGLLSSRKR